MPFTSLLDFIGLVVIGVPLSWGSRFTLSRVGFHERALVAMGWSSIRT